MPNGSYDRELGEIQATLKSISQAIGEIKSDFDTVHLRLNSHAKELSMMKGIGIILSLCYSGFLAFLGMKKGG